MAIVYFSASIISRCDCRSAVLSAAYRHCAKMEYEREARTINYTRKQGLLHQEFVLPVDAPKWVRALIADRSVSGVVEAFWNRVESFEKRSDAQLARDLTIALPLKLTPEQNIALVRDFVEKHILAKGMVADWVYHDSPGNPHIHLMTTLRPLTEDGFGAKKVAVTGEDDHLTKMQKPLVVFDRLAHATLAYHKPVVAAETAVETIAHNDIEALETLCKTHPHVAYVCDGVYSMGGSAPLAALKELQAKYGLVRRAIAN